MRMFFFAALFLWALPGFAAQKQPYQFDVNLADKPAEVQQMIDDYSQGIPDLPTERLAESTHDGPVALWLFPDSFDLLGRMVATDKSDFVWPRDTTSCAAHAAFFLPQMLVTDASVACQNAYSSLQDAVALRTACGDAAEPERYVLDYPPGTVDDSNTDTVLELIGVMGSTFTQFPPLYDGVLPEGFVPQLRDVLRKLRHDELKKNLDTQIASFQAAQALLEEHVACFVPSKRLQTIERLAAMIGEASAQRDLSEELRTTGETAYQKEILKLGVHSRTRNELPYPSLTQADREFLAFWIGGIYWRLRGGGIIKLDGTQDCRRLGLRRPFGVIGELAGGAHGQEAADGIYCEIFSGWGEWFDMGTTPGQEDKYYDLVKMTNRGYEQIRTAVSGTTALNPCTIPDPPFVLELTGLNSRGYDTTELFAAGLTMGPCYYFPWDQLLGWTWAHDMELPYIQAIDGPTAIGEVCIGGALGVGLTRTLLHGWATGLPPTCTIDCEGRVCGDDKCGDVCGYCDEGLICEEATGQCVAELPDEAMPEEDALMTDDTTDMSEADKTNMADDEDTLLPEETADNLSGDEDVLLPDTPDSDTVAPKGKSGGCGCSLLF